MTVSPQTVALVACSAAKLDRPAPARDLYVGQLFRLARAWSERFADAWFILSARHRVLDPGETVAPYDFSMVDRARGLGNEPRTPSPLGLPPRLSPEPPEVWASKCRGQLMGARGGLPRGARVLYGDRVVLLAGAAYRHPLAEWLRAWGAVVECPLAHLGIGRQKQWLRLELDRWADRELSTGAARPVDVGARATR